jgi:hypothetical protein
MKEPFRHTHDSTVAAGQVTITQLQSDRMDLQQAVDDLVLAFHRKHPFVSLDLSVSGFYGEPQVTVTLTIK